MSPLRIHEIGSIAEAQAVADELQARINRLEDERAAAFGPAVQALAAETARARRFPTDHEED